MQRLKLALFMLVIAAVSAPRFLAAEDPGPVFPLLGKWRVVGRTDAKGIFHKIKNGDLYVYSKNHTFALIAAGDKEPASEQSWDFDTPGDMYLQKETHGDSDHSRRVRFHVKGDTAILKISALDATADPDDKPEGALKLQRIK